MAKKQMSREGYEKLEQKLSYLITVRRAEVAQKLKEARSFGDLSENAEYDEAKNEQGILEAEIAELEAQMADPALYSDPQRAADVQRAYQLAQQTLQTLYEQWEAAEAALQEEA